MKDKNYQAFLKTDLSKARPGQYVVFIDGKLFKKGINIEKILKEAKEKYPSKTPFVSKMPQRGTLII